MARIVAVAGQIWRDDCYYFDRVTGECKRKFVLVLAVDSTSGDLVTAVFTSNLMGWLKSQLVSSDLLVPAITWVFRGKAFRSKAGLNSAALTRWIPVISPFT